MYTIAVLKLCIRTLASFQESIAKFHYLLVSDARKEGIVLAAFVRVSVCVCPRKN